MNSTPTTETASSADVDPGVSWTVRRDAPGISFPGEIRERIRRSMDGDEEYELLYTAELVAGELVTNAVLHGGQHVIVEFLWRGGVAVVTVHDCCPRHIDAPKRPAEECGRGLAIVTALGGDFCTSTLPEGTYAQWHSEPGALHEGFTRSNPRNAWDPCPHAPASQSTTS
ncbi:MULTISPECIES: ATP-binding protein [Streptomyces]|uniref:ATP-binding protein n=1 Tax=Streptomyces evansiae TaxID=3075535 RepID=A0ABU2QTQ7_9ACTN|nr:MULTISPECIES: ATP-binding protein [unclassified Streptomyces]MDT0407807.1 ATP-binding protein [Streptomyces sp. DSM 41979]MYQ60871.1 ATP-binding protein [Streptomyces sp. SID4926]SCE19558.1 Histidine kinase-like ATPase domain-containing protein [Streptomyces sp. DfronAA-171]